MSPGNRIGLCAQQKAELWSRWKAGQSLHEIGRAFGKNHVVIHFVLARHGGIAPATRRRPPRTLTLAEREDVSRGIAGGSSIGKIARGLQRVASRVSREVVRHGGRPLYRSNDADRQAWASAWRPKTCLLARHGPLRELVASKLLLDWSPEQISGWLNNQYPQNGSLRVSHETIYRSLFLQARGVLQQELVKHLRSQRRTRRSRHSRDRGHRCGQIVDAISIQERPAEIEDRAGHGYIDPLNSQVLSGLGTSPDQTSRKRKLKVGEKANITGNTGTAPCRDRHYAPIFLVKIQDISTD